MSFTMWPRGGGARYVYIKVNQLTLYALPLLLRTYPPPYSIKKIWSYLINQLCLKLWLVYNLHTCFAAKMISLNKKTKIVFFIYALQLRLTVKVRKTVFLCLHNYSPLMLVVLVMKCKHLSKKCPFRACEFP